MSFNGRERIEKYLNRQLMLLEEGQKLPPIRTIMLECGASQAPIQSVLKRFEANGIIRSSARQGYFKAQEVAASRSFEELDLVYCTTVKDEDPMMKFHGDFSHLLGKICGESWRSVRFHFLEGATDLERIEQLARNSRCRACILVAPGNLEIGRILRANHVAYVNLFPASLQLDEEAANIMIDNEEAVHQQLDFLVRLGHRRIAYLHTIREDEWIRDLRMRREAFLRQSLTYGLPLNPDWVQFGGYDSEICCRAMRKILSGKIRPTAVIAHDHHIPAIYQVLNEFGMVPGRDFSVLGTDNLSITRVLVPQASSLDISRGEAARMALDALEKTLKGETVNRKMFVPLRIAARASTCPIANAEQKKNQQ